MSREKWEELCAVFRDKLPNMRTPDTWPTIGHGTVETILWADSRMKKLERMAESMERVRADAVLTMFRGQPAISISTYGELWRELIESLRALDEE